MCVCDYLRMIRITETCNFKKKCYFHLQTVAKLKHVDVWSGKHIGKMRCIPFQHLGFPQSAHMVLWGKEKQHVAGATPRHKRRPATSTKPFSFFSVVIIFLIICCLSASARSSACCCLGPGRAKLKLGTAFWFAICFSNIFAEEMNGSKRVKEMKKANATEVPQTSRTAAFPGTVELDSESLRTSKHFVKKSWSSVWHQQHWRNNLWTAIF